MGYFEELSNKHRYITVDGKKAEFLGINKDGKIADRFDIIKE